MTSKDIPSGIYHELPTDIQTELRKNSKALSAWRSITPIARNEFICWVVSAKQDKTRTRRIQRTVEELNEGQRRPCCWVGCIHRTDKKPSRWQKEVLIDKKVS